MIRRESSGAKLKQHQRREGALKILGYLCVCCGERNPALLQFDHVNNDGRIDRKTLGRKRSEASIKEILMMGSGAKSKYQLLCASCNWGKATHGICPHQKG